MTTPNIVGLIPARSGSRRVPGKNVKLLGNKPLMAWSIESALESGVFSRVLVCTDSVHYAGVAKQHGAEVCMREPAADDEPDIVWVRRVLMWVECETFAILRPTSPFRCANTIRRAWQTFLESQPADSLRAVEPVRQHPGKMWVIRGGRLLPLLPFETGSAPWHSSATQTLPPVYAQNASLEIAWRRTVMIHGTIAGTNVVPFLTEGIEGTDVNTLEDWERAEQVLARRAQHVG